MTQPYRIPIRFRLFGQTIRVVWDPEMRHSDDHTGQARYRFNEIRIQPSVEGSPRTADSIEHTFFHELMHWVLYYAGWAYEAGKRDLHDDERLVDLCAGLLHQALTTMEYE